MFVVQVTLTTLKFYTPSWTFFLQILKFKERKYDQKNTIKLFICIRKLKGSAF